MNELLQSLDPDTRRKIYLVTKILSVALCVLTAVVLVVTAGAIPVWLAATTAGVLALGVPFQAQTASANVSIPIDVTVGDVEPEPNPAADLEAGVIPESEAEMTTEDV